MRLQWKMFPCDHSENGSFFQIIDDGVPNGDFISNVLIFLFILDNKYIHKGNVTLLISYKIRVYWKMFPCDLRKSDYIFQILYNDLPYVDYFVNINYFFCIR